MVVKMKGGELCYVVKPTLTTKINALLSTGTTRKRTMEVKLNRLHWMPWIFVISLVSSVAVVFVWSVLLGDVPVFLPYISDTGGHAPQSALFGLAVMVCAFSAATSFVVRFYSVKAANSEKPRKVVTVLNYLALLNGCLLCLGMLMVSTNPVSHLRRDGTWKLPVLAPHLVGAGILFINAGAYFIIQTCFVWLLGQKHQVTYLGYVRTAANLISFVGAIALVVFAPYDDLEGLRPVAEHGTLYKGNSPWSAFGEWVLIFGFLCNILSMVPDLKRVRVSLHVENIQEASEKEPGNEVMKL